MYCLYKVLSVENSYCSYILKHSNLQYYNSDIIMLKLVPLSSTKCKEVIFTVAMFSYFGCHGDSIAFSCTVKFII